MKSISPLTGRIRVVDYRSERRLIVAGEILSIFPLNGDWSYIRKEYWWHALALAAPERGGTALFVGLGGGTQVHLLTRLARPKLVTLIERDPEMITIACDWFDLRKLGPLEFMCGEAQDLLPTLNAAGRQFDLVVEDAAYAAEPEQSMAIGKALATAGRSRRDHSSSTATAAVTAGGWPRCSASDSTRSEFSECDAKARTCWCARIGPRRVSSTRRVSSAAAACSAGGAADRPRRRGAACDRPRSPRSCPRTTPPCPRPRRPACAWRSGRGTSGRG